MSDTPLKCTTRHVRIFTATVEESGELKASDDKLTLDLDPDNEFDCLLYTSPSPRDRQKSRMPSSA